MRKSSSSPLACPMGPKIWTILAHKHPLRRVYLWGTQDVLLKDGRTMSVSYVSTAKTLLGADVTALPNTVTIQVDKEPFGQLLSQASMEGIIPLSSLDTLSLSDKILVEIPGRLSAK